MKHVLLSADGELSVYSVPDPVADNLSEYCCDFANDWLRNSPHADKYRMDGIVCYDESDFIQYLNDWLFPDSPSTLVETLHGVWSISKAPEEYKHYEWFNF